MTPALRKCSSLLQIIFTRVGVSRSVYSELYKLRKYNLVTMCEVKDRFEHLYTGFVDNFIPISKWRSYKSGITLYTALVDGPIVNGNFYLATEAHDDDGLPHTLEHLIFMGSHNYPYKGVLDRMANRSLASGTNAWTDTDHTSYTLTTAGSQGFLNLLPVYLDHILFPTLKESAFVTEVHHINARGEDGGVVYAEMQAREQTCEDIMQYAVQQHIYPDNCGYRYETGGRVANIRSSTNNQSVTAYHKKFYTPANLHICVTGQIDEDKLMAAIVDYENIVMHKMSNVMFEKPWQIEIAALSGSVDEEVLYPSEEEDCGRVNVAWRAPRAENQYHINCLTTIMDYLTDTANSPLEKTFVDEKSLCSSVSYILYENMESCLVMEFDNVPMDKLGSIVPILTSVLKSMVDTRNIDMARLKTLIEKQTQEALLRLETQSHSTIESICIGDMLFSETLDDFALRLNPVRLRKQMLAEEMDYWLDFITQWLLNKPSITIRGRPSSDYMNELADTESDRVEAQCEKLGEEGLLRLGAKLDEATSNNKPPPTDVVAAMPVPSVESIKFHPLKVFTNTNNTMGCTANSKFHISDIKFNFQLDDVHTNFVKMTALLDTTGLSHSLRMYLPLYTEMLFELPIKRDGKLVPYTEVVNEIEAHTLNNVATIGVDGDLFDGGAYPHVVSVLIKVEREKYRHGVELLRELLVSTVFDVGRVKVWVSKLLKEISSMRRDENAVLNALINHLHYNAECNHSLVTIFKQKAFLEQLKKKLESAPDQAFSSILAGNGHDWVVKDLETVRSTLLDEKNLRLHLCVDVDKLIETHPEPERVWVDFVTDNSSSSILQEETHTRLQTHQFILPLSGVTSPHLIMGVGGVESNYLFQTAESISSHTHPDLPALLVLTQYLRQCEGPLWVEIRGSGLAYDFDLSVNAETGLVHLALSESTNLIETYIKARDIIMDYTDGRRKFDKEGVESAISSMLFELVEKGKTVAGVSAESMLSYYKGVDTDYTRKRLGKIAEVELDQLLPAANKYLSPLFDVSCVRSAICCNPSQVKDNATQFKRLGFHFKETKESNLNH